MPGRIYRYFIFVIILLKVAGCTPTPQNHDTILLSTDIQTPLTENNVYAVLSYAEWCASCRVIYPKIEQSRAIAEDHGIVFLKLDYTQKNDSAFYAEADRLGIGVAVRFYMDGTIKTGRLMIIRAGEDRIAEFATMNHTPQEIESRLLNAVNATP